MAYPKALDSPHLLEQALAQDLQDLTLEGGTFIHYIDDLLICSPTQSLHSTVCLLRLSLLVQCDQSGKDGEALSSWEWESKAGHI